jgi:hypothetical protein
MDERARNETDVSMGFTTEDNKKREATGDRRNRLITELGMRQMSALMRHKGSFMACRMFDEEYVEWENATTKCQELGARLPVLSDADTIKIVKKYLETAEFEVFEVRILITGLKQASPSSLTRTPSRLSRSTWRLQSLRSLR